MSRQKVSYNNLSKSRKNDNVKEKTRNPESISKQSQHKRVKDPIAITSNAAVVAKTTPTSVTSTTTSMSQKQKLATSTITGKNVKTENAAASKRVTKQTYFPAKYPFSSHLRQNKDNAEEHQSKEKILKKIVKKDTNTSSINKDSNRVTAKPFLRERTLTRILSASEIKVIKQNIAAEQMNNNNNNSNNTIATTANIDVEQDTTANEYEDDFESYESDFETESGDSYASSSSPSSCSQVRTDENTDSESNCVELHSPGDANDHTNSNSDVELHSANANNASSNSDDDRKLDSGTFDMPDVKHKQILSAIQESIDRENNMRLEPVGSIHSFSDEGFDEDSIKCLNPGVGNGDNLIIKEEIVIEKIKANRMSKRGFDLMNMIRLNVVGFSLLDMDAATYESFVQHYGRNGTIQMSTQSDSLQNDAEVETDAVQTETQSTQFPIRMSVSEARTAPDLTRSHQGRFTRLDCSRISQLMLNVLEYRSLTAKAVRFNNNSLQLGAYERTPFLKGRCVSSVTFTHDTYKLLTVHNSNVQRYMDANRQLLSRATICIWNFLSAQTEPEDMLLSSGEISRICLDKTRVYLVFAAVSDGTINVWDLRGSAQACGRTIYDEATDRIVTLRLAIHSTTTAEPFRITAIHAINLQVCTLNEVGTIIVWSVIEKRHLKDSIRLVQGATISLQTLNPTLNELYCFDLQRNPDATELNHFYVASNYGIFDCCLNNPKQSHFIAEQRDNALSPALVCLDLSPFDANYLLAGFRDGSCALFSHQVRHRPLKVFDSTHEQAQTYCRLVRWSQCRPCIFYVINSINEISIWNIAASDIWPVQTIQLAEDNIVTDMKLSYNTRLQDLRHNCIMAVATKTGQIYLHQIKEEFCYQTSEQHQTELKTFRSYLSRL